MSGFVSVVWVGLRRLEMNGLKSCGFGTCGMDGWGGDCSGCCGGVDGCGGGGGGESSK